MLTRGRPQVNLKVLNKWQIKGIGGTVLIAAPLYLGGVKEIGGRMQGG